MSTIPLLVCAVAFSSLHLAYMEDGLMAEELDGGVICVSGSLDSETRTLFGPARLVDTMIYAIGDAWTRRISGDPKLADRHRPVIGDVEKLPNCRNVDAQVKFEISLQAKSYAYRISATARSGTRSTEFSVNRPTGERTDVLALTNAPKSAYVVQSITLDLKSLGAEIANFFLGERQP